MIDIAIAILTRFAELITAPVFMNPEMLWIIIPVYLNWLVADLYQEKRGASFGNVISNGFVCLWTGMDWLRTLFKGLQTGTIGTVSIFVFIMAIAVLIYGLLIMIEGIRGKKIAKYIGRIREVSYFIVALTPVFYGLIDLDLLTIIAVLAFFPVSYILSAVIIRLIPAKSEEELEGAPKEFVETEMNVPSEGIEATSLETGEQTHVKVEQQKQTVYSCPYCKQPLTYLEPYKRYYCYSCKRYV